MIKQFLLKQMLKSKMKDVPEEEREKALRMVEKNPDLFMKIAEEVKQKVTSGKTERDAAIEVFRDQQEELKGFM